MRPELRLERVGQWRARAKEGERGGEYVNSAQRIGVWCSPHPGKTRGKMLSSREACDVGPGACKMPIAAEGQTVRARELGGSYLWRAVLGWDVSEEGWVLGRISVSRVQTRGLVGRGRGEATTRPRG